VEAINKTFGHKQTSRQENGLNHSVITVHHFIL
jgi:hypothetical protein